AVTSLTKQLTGLGSALPALRPDPGPQPAVTTVSELARADALTLHRNVGGGRFQLDEDGAGTGPLVLTGRDVVSGVAPTARLGSADPSETVELQPGDLVVPLLVAGDGRVSTRVVADGGVLLGPNLALLRVDPRRLDAHFLAGQLRTGGASRAGSTASGVHRFDVRRVEVPVVDIARQRSIGAAFRALAEFERGLDQAHSAGAALARQITDALASGVGLPDSPDAGDGAE